MAKIVHYISQLMPASWLTSLPITVPTNAKLIRFNPCSINRMIKSADYKKLNPNSIWYSDWHKFTTILGKDYIHPTIDAIYNCNVHYTETRQYKKMRRAIELYLVGNSDNPAADGAYWCRNYSDLDKYFEILDSCYHQIKQSGFKSQAELKSCSPELISKPGDELKVVIGPEGEAVFVGVGGNHRFSIVRHLGITSVSGLLVGVDKDWALKNVTFRGFGGAAAYESIRRAAENSLLDRS